MRTGSSIEYKPIELESNSDWLQDRRDAGGLGAAEAGWRAADLHAWAFYCDLTLAAESQWPTATSLALRGAIAAIEAGRGCGLRPAGLRGSLRRRR